MYECFNQLQPLLGSLTLHDWCDFVLDFDELIQVFDLNPLHDLCKYFVAFLLGVLVFYEALDAKHELDLVLSAELYLLHHGDEDV